MDMSKDAIPFPEPFKQDFSWTDDKVLPEPENAEPDFSWADEEGYSAKDNERNPHEIKDELAKQWNGNLIPYTQENNSTKNVLKLATKNVIAQQVRTMMNQGFTPSVIRDRLAKTQKKEIVALFKEDIDKQLKLYGSVGRFVLDARGYKNCEEAFKTASRNPWRKYMTHVIGCKCGTPKKVQRIASVEGDIETSSGDGFGSFLSEGKPDQSDTVTVCPNTGAQILSGENDIDAQWAGNTMFDIINASSFDKEEGKKFLASGATPYQSLKRFFIAIDESAIPLEKTVEAPVTEVYSPAGMEFETDSQAPEADVNLNSPDNGIAFVIPESKGVELPPDLNVQGDNALSFIMPEDKQDIPLDINRGVANVEFEIPESAPVDVELVQADPIRSFDFDKSPSQPLAIELGECEPEVVIGDSKLLEIGFGAESDTENDIVL